MAYSFNDDKNFSNPFGAILEQESGDGEATEGMSGTDSGMSGTGSGVGGRCREICGEDPKRLPNFEVIFFFFLTIS